MLKLRFALFGCLLILLAGCGGRAFGGFEPQVKPVTNKVVVLPVQYLEGQNAGPLYNVSITLPDAWVGHFATSNNGNVVSFSYNQKVAKQKAGQQAPIFTITALSQQQYWQQISYPGSYKSILSTGDTYFIYNMPIDAYYSGLEKDAYAALTKQVPSVITSFQAQLSH